MTGTARAGHPPPPPSNTTETHPTVKLLYLQYSLHLLPGLKMCTEPQRVGVGTWGYLERAGHWSPWLYHGVPQPLSHTPALGHLLTGLRAQVDSIWKAWLFQELLDQAGERARKELHFHGGWGGGWRKDRGLKTKDSGSGCQWKTAPHPYTSLALTSLRKPNNTWRFSHTCPGVP